MRVLILADEVFAARERSLLDRLEVGLAAEGIRVVHLIPEGAVWSAGSAVFSPIMRYADRGPILTRGLRVRRLVRLLSEQFAGEDGRLVDVVHAFGGSSWSVAVELARQLGAAVALEVWRAGLVGRAGALKTSAPDSPGPVLFAPDKAIERALLSEHAVGSVRVAPWGVHIPAEGAKERTEGRSVSLIVAGSGQDAPSYAAALEGIAGVARADRGMMVFMDADTARRAGLWGVARRLGLLDRLTLVPDLEARRELALMADVLVLPGATGEHRTLTLDAMAARMAVVAAADPWVSALAHNRTAKLVERPEARLWAAALGSVLDQPDEAAALGNGAREYVKQHHRASTYVAAVLDAYEWLASNETLPFPTGGG